MDIFPNFTFFQMFSQIANFCKTFPLIASKHHLSYACNMSLTVIFSNFTNLEGLYPIIEKIISCKQDISFFHVCNWVFYFLSNFFTAFIIGYNIINFPKRQFFLKSGIFNFKVCLLYCSHKGESKPV